MNFKTTILLFVMLVLVGAAAWYIVRNQPVPGTTPNATPASGLPGAGAGAGATKDLFPDNTLAASSVDTVTIAYGDKTAVLSRVAGQWVQTQPISYPLESTQITNLIDTAAALSFSRRVSPGSSGAPTLADMNLDPPLLTITFGLEGPGKRGHTLRLGRIVPGAPLGYLLCDDDPHVYLAQDGLHRMLLPVNDSPETVIRDWRSKMLLAPAVAQVDQVTLTREGVTTQLDQRDGQWALTAPHTGRADADAVRALIAAVARLRVERFVDDHAKDLASFGLAQPAVVLSLRVPPATPGPTPGLTPGLAPAPTPGPATAPAATAPGAAPLLKTLRIGSVMDKCYATWSEGPSESRMVFEIPKFQLEALSKSPDDLRDPRLATAAAADVRQISVAHSGQVAFTLTRTAPDQPWSFADPKPAFDADSADVNQALAALTQTRCHSFVPDARPALPELAAITLAATGAPAPEVLHVFATQPADGQVVVIRNNETTGYRVDAAHLSRLTDSALAVRNRQVIVMNGKPVPGNDEITALRITQPQAGAVPLVLTFERPIATVPTDTQPATTSRATSQPMTVIGPWKMVGGPEKFESAAVESLAAQLINLRAERWLPADHAAPSAAAIHVDFGWTKLPLVVDPVTRRAWFNPAEPFEVGSALADAVAAEFRFRTVVDVPSADILKITVAGPAGSITVERDEAGKFISPDGRKLDQPAAGALFDALGGLRVERFVPAPKQAAAGPHLIVQPRQGQPLDLQLASTDPDAPNARLAALAGQWFKLSRTTIDKLRADLVAKDDAP